MWTIHIEKFSVYPKIEITPKYKSNFIKCENCKELNKIEADNNNNFKYKEYYDIKYENEDLLKLYKTNTSCNTEIVKKIVKKMIDLLKKYDMSKKENEVEFILHKKYSFWNSNDSNKIIINEDYFENIKDME